MSIYNPSDVAPVHIAICCPLPRIAEQVEQTELVRLFWVGYSGYFADPDGYLGGRL